MNKSQWFQKIMHVELYRQLIKEDSYLLGSHRHHARMISQIMSVFSEICMLIINTILHAVVSIHIKTIPPSIKHGFNFPKYFFNKTICSHYFPVMLIFHCTMSPGEILSENRSYITSYFVI
jgi:hypothetical protein